MALTTHTEYLSPLTIVFTLYRSGVVNITMYMYTWPSVQGHGEKSGGQLDSAW